MASNSNNAKKRFVMSDGDTDTLTTIVEGKKGLWDHGYPDYKAKKLEKDLWWDDAGKMLKCSGNQCFNRWKNLLRDFRRELKNVPKPRSGDAASTYKPQFKWFERMRFVIDSVTPRKSSGILEKMLSKSKKSHRAGSSDEDLTEDDEAAYQDNLADYAKLLFSPKQKKKNTKTQPHHLSEREEDSNTKTVAQLEEHEHYMRSVVPRIRHLTDVQNLLFRGELSELVIKFPYQDTGLYGNKM